MNSMKQQLPQSDRENKKALWGWLIAATIGAIIIACAAALSSWLDSRAKTVATTESVGVLIDATFAGSLMNDTTAVRTSNGTFRVYGTFQVSAGHPAEIRTYQNGNRLLCDRIAESCKKLIQ